MLENARQPLCAVKARAAFCFDSSVSLRGARKEMASNKAFVFYAEEALKQLAKAAGGRWDPAIKLWRIPYGKIKGTPLEKHIVLDA